MKQLARDSDKYSKKLESALSFGEGILSDRLSNGPTSLRSMTTPINEFTWEMTGQEYRDMIKNADIVTMDTIRGDSSSIESEESLEEVPEESPKSEEEEAPKKKRALFKLLNKLNDVKGKGIEATKALQAKIGDMMKTNKDLRFIEIPGRFPGQSIKAYFSFTKTTIDVTIMDIDTYGVPKTTDFVNKYVESITIKGSDDNDGFWKELTYEMTLEDHDGLTVAVLKVPKLNMFINDKTDKLRLIFTVVGF